MSLRDNVFVEAIAQGKHGKDEVLRYLDVCPDLWDKVYSRKTQLEKELLRAQLWHGENPIIPSSESAAHLTYDEAIKRLGDALQWLDEALKQPQPAPAEQGENGLPLEIDTEGARKRFERAISANYMQRTKDGYKWLKTQIQLGYFCLNVFDNPRPINALERLFDVKKLSASISSAESHKSNPKARADVRKWINDIERAIFAD